MAYMRPPLSGEQNPYISGLATLEKIVWDVAATSERKRERESGSESVRERARERERERERGREGEKERGREGE
jgi:hypothetical protein